MPALIFAIVRLAVAGDADRRRYGVASVLRWRLPGRLLACLASLLLSAPLFAEQPGTVSGRLSYDGKVYVLRHVYAWQPPLQDDEMWIYLTDEALPPAAAQDPVLPEQLARDRRFAGVKLIVSPAKPCLDDIRGVVYAPRADGFSLDRFNFGPSWQALRIKDHRVSGKARTAWMSWTLDAEFAAPVEGSTGSVRTITGMAAQDSPQAAVFVAFEQALVDHGLDAAGAYLTTAKLADLRGRVERFGEASFTAFRKAQRARTAPGEARRRQIERVNVDGDHAEVVARSGPDSVHTALLIKITGEWKIAEW